VSTKRVTANDLSAIVNPQRACIVAGDIDRSKNAVPVEESVKKAGPIPVVSDNIIRIVNSNGFGESGIGHNQGFISS
jgi:hypothetical protein